MLLAVAAVWLLAVLISWGQWLTSDDRNPDNVALMLAAIVLPGLVTVAVALVLTGRTRNGR
ncbi:hypothetical protein V2I01_21950 [Micromonospora sp. BRA006-A]|nr:hypothetical protein [Micromonospora sp. BRA006-A]